MKKLIFSLMSVAVSISLMAAPTKTANIQLSGSNPTYSVSNVVLIEDAARSSAVEDGFDSPCMMSQTNDNSTLIYGMIAGSEYSTVATNSIDALYLGFKTNNVDQNYKLTFTSVTGEFELYDLVADTHFTVNASTPAYNFSVSADQVGRVAINNRFVINYDPSSLKVCFIDNVIQVLENPYSENIVVKDANGDDAISPVVAGPVPQEISLDALEDGRYNVQFGGGAKNFLVIVKH